MEELDVLTLNTQPQDTADEEEVEEDLLRSSADWVNGGEFQLQIEQEGGMFIQVSPESAKIKSHSDKLSYSGPIC